MVVKMFVVLTGKTAQQFVADCRGISERKFVGHIVKKQRFNQRRFGLVWNLVQTRGDLFVPPRTTTNAWDWYSLRGVGLRGRGRASDLVAVDGVVLFIHAFGPGSVVLLHVDEIVGIRHGGSDEKTDFRDVFVIGRTFNCRPATGLFHTFQFHTSNNIRDDGLVSVMSASDVTYVALVIHKHKLSVRVCVFFCRNFFFVQTESGFSSSSAALPFLSRISGGVILSVGDKMFQAWRS
jgi:hypothetical protein